jgi:hypothetical protein
MGRFRKGLERRMGKTSMRRNGTETLENTEIEIQTRRKLLELIRKRRRALFVRRLGWRIGTGAGTEASNV